MEEFGKEIEKELPERKISQDDSVIAAKKGWNFNNNGHDINSDIIGITTANIFIMLTKSSF